jgi:hypothetical protein
VKGRIPDLTLGGAPDVPARSSVEQELVDEFALDFSPEELHEFLVADLVDAGADPAFKQQLKDKLLALVHERYGPAVEPRRRRNGRN